MQTLSQDLAAPTARPASIPRKARPPAKRPRIARRFVPRHSLAITLDWNLTSSEKNCLCYLLSKPRMGALIYGTSAGEIGIALDKSARTARRWLKALEQQKYLHVMPGRRRGSLVILLAAKATRWCQLREGDFTPQRKTPKPSEPRPCAGSRPRMSASKDRGKDKQEEKEEAQGEAPAAAPETPAEPVKLAPAHPLERRLEELIWKHRGTPDGRYYQSQLMELRARWEARRKAADG